MFVFESDNNFVWNFEQIRAKILRDVIDRLLILEVWRARMDVLSLVICSPIFAGALAQ